MRNVTLVLAVGGLLILAACNRSGSDDPQIDQAIKAAEALLQKGEGKEALAQIEPLVKAHPDVLELRLSAARAAHMAGHSETALQHLLEARKLDDSDSRSSLMLGRLYNQYGQWRQASEAFEDALAKGAAPGDVRIGLGMALGKLRNFDRAVVLFTEEIEQKGDLVSAYYNRGVARQATGEWAAALEDYRAALRVDDKSIAALEGLARFLIDCDDHSMRNPTEALALADKAVALAPQDPEVLLLLARTQEANGDPSSGARTLEKALDLGPDDGRIYREHLVRMRTEAGESGASGG